LIELLMGVALLAVLAALAMPSYAGLIARTHQRTSQDALITDVNSARMAAVSRSVEVVVCPSEDQITCTRTTQWQHGWMLFADADRDGERSPDETVIAAAQAQPPGVAIVTSSGRPRIGFKPSGGTTGTNITLTVCDRNAEPGAAASVILNLAGRARTAPASTEAEAACKRSAG
jgi:type IV fimbrial biogenesis protein FimT